MIPVKLNMHNFMCYRDNVPSVSFDNIHTACISGDNGNGILDATVTGMWSGGWAYSDGMNIPDLLVVGVDNAWAAYCVRDWTWEACPAGTVDFIGNWDTDDLGGDRIDHLSLLQAVRPMSGVTCTVPEPNTLLLVMLALAVLYLTLRICFITRG